VTEVCYEMKMPRSEISPDRGFVLNMLVVQTLRTVQGEVWEAGVYRGGSARFLATRSAEARPQRIVRLFDTFEGMPNPDPEHDTHQKGDFSDTSVDQVRQFVGFPRLIRIHRGLVPETFVGLENSRIAFAHIDLDLYHSVADALEFIYPRLSPGGVIVLDDYGFETTPGAKEAADEFVDREGANMLVVHTKQAIISPPQQRGLP
jgi:O-methyltransferase